jgi:hypothetical protein
LSNQLLIDTLAIREHAKYHILSQLEATEPGWETGQIHRELGAILDTFIIACERKLSPNLIICLPPRAGKTITVGRHFPAQVLGRHPNWEFAYATYSTDRALDVGRKVRSNFENPVIQDIHPRLRIDTRRNSADNISLLEGGEYFAVGRGGPFTGRGAHVLVIDDILKDKEEAKSQVIKEGMWDWYTAVARTRVYPGYGKIIMSTRWVVDDLAGRVLDNAKADPDADQWMVYSYEALATKDEAWRKAGTSFFPERFPEKFLLQTKASISASDWAALYQQSPYVEEGNHFKAKDFQFYDPTKLPDNLTWGVTTDFASTEDGGDNSVSWPFGMDKADNIYFGPDIFSKKCEISAHDDATFDQLEKHKSRLLFVEKGVLLNAHRPEFRRQIEKRRWYPKIIEFARTKNKLAHAGALMAHMQNRKVFWPDTPHMRNEIMPRFLRFTGDKGSKDDDEVDAATLPFLSFKEIQRPYDEPLEIEDAPVDPTTKYIHDQMQRPNKRRVAPFSAGQRDHRDGDDEEAE